MANDINTVALSGRLGQPLEIRYTPSGDAVTNFSLAVGRAYKKKNSDEWTTETSWIDCVAFKFIAERLAEKALKGSLLSISGQLKTREWEDKSGNKRKSTEVHIREAVIMQKTESMGAREDQDIPF